MTPSPTLPLRRPLSPPLAPMELVCPAGSLPALKAAVDHGADCVYLGFRDATNARNFAGLNFDDAAIATGIRYAHERGRKVLVALNTYPQAGDAGALAPRRGPGRRHGRGRRHPGRPGPDAVRRHSATRAAPAPVGAGLGHQRRRDQFLPRAVRHRARRAAARAVADAGASSVVEQDPGRDRGVRLWQPVRDGRGALRAVVLRHRRSAQHARRVLAAQGRALAGNPQGPGVAPERRADRPLRPRRKRRLPDAVQGPLRRGRATTTTTPSKSPPA